MTTSQAGDIFQPGDVLNNTYRIEEILGRGGTSEVYKARSEISGRVIAIKALKAEFASNEDFLVLMTREEDVREIRHDAVVRYFDTQRMPDGVVYLVMDHVDGPGLDEKMRAGTLTASELMVIGRRVCEGLIAAHGRNIVHRDLSPDNIILRDDDPAEAVIIDFGIAKDTNPGAKTIVGNEFAGKYSYAAPEQLSGQTDARSDIYSLGALLLATFRGEKPAIGANPMEMVQLKSAPLDLQGVPDPLARLIAKMSAPDPAQRFQSAEELLAAFNNPDSVDAFTASDPLDDLLDDDKTVIPNAMPAAQYEQSVTKAPPAASEPTKTKRGSGGLIAALLALVVVGGGAGAWFTGLLDEVLGTGLPMVEPYTLVVERRQDGSVTAVGHMPDEESLTALTERLAPLGARLDVTLARGNIIENWGDGLLEVLSTSLPLDEFRLAAIDNEVAVTGLAGNPTERAAVQSKFDSDLPAGLIGATDIALGPRFLAEDVLQPILDGAADCGPLRLAAVPPLGYGLNDLVIVSGRFGSQARRDALELGISEVAGDRQVRIEGEVLNESLCRIDATLPKARLGGFDVRLGYGGQTAENLSGTYKVGENPTIDIRLPAERTDGFLYVSVVDVKGVVFHLLPNRSRPENGLQALQEEAQNGFLRVAYGLEEAQDQGHLAFTVDDSALGKSKILAIYTTEALFDGLRPTTESVASYAEALAQARDTGGLLVQSMDSAILTSER